MIHIKRFLFGLFAVTLFVFSTVAVSVAISMFPEVLFSAVAFLATMGFCYFVGSQLMRS